MIQVLLTANYLERISCLVYKGADGNYKKLSAAKYKKGIFESYAESYQEVYERVQTYGASENRLMQRAIKVREEVKSLSKVSIATSEIVLNFDSVYDIILNMT